MQDNNTSVPIDFKIRYDDQTGKPIVDPASENNACVSLKDAGSDTCNCEAASNTAQNHSQNTILSNKANVLPQAVSAPSSPQPVPQQQSVETRFAQVSRLYSNEPQQSAEQFTPYSHGFYSPPQTVPQAFYPTSTPDPNQAQDLIAPASCAGFFTRLAAFTIDSLIAWIMSLVVGGIFSSISIATDQSLSQPVFFQFSVIVIVKYLVVVAYFVILTKYTGYTLGKKLLRIKVISSDAQPLSWWNVIYRETIGRYLSSIFYIGYLVLAFDKKHRAFHDMLCDTRVIFAAQ